MNGLVRFALGLANMPDATVAELERSLPEFAALADDAKVLEPILKEAQPLIDKATGARRSALAEAADLLAELVTQGVRTICFLKSRRGIELIQRFARENLERRGKKELAARIAPYRGGYTPQQRREIEDRLSRGELLAVVATDALELGIDVGELDAAICVTFPGTVASLRQMWGRAGRRRRGLAVYVAGQDALDQFFCRHPEEFLGRPVEAAILDHANEQIAMRQRQVQASQAQLAAVGAQQKKASVRLGFAQLVAPVGGVVDVMPARIGEVITTGQAVMTLVNPDDLWVRADIEETYIDRIRLGDTFTVRLPSGDVRIGTVIYRRPDASFATHRDVSRTKRDIRTFETRLRVDNTDRHLAVGMTVYVMLPVHEP